MNTSIHRPERCLPAQGWTIVNSDRVAVPIDHQVLTATRLRDVRSVSLQNGQPLTLRSICYYWFVGHSDTTPSHYERAWIDIRDRVLKGQNQQWAYVTVATTVTKDFRIFGRDESQADALIRDFLRELVPRLEREPKSPQG